ncbi:hypothetical protein F5Y13DRAFT_167104 [Hypoxylon sp. FL1857]|nr:hypothetical protein F5Y13DRAFT_167104 [Hypoxylon sp. FL1857]
MRFCPMSLVWERMSCCAALLPSMSVTTLPYGWLYLARERRHSHPAGSSKPTGAEAYGAVSWVDRWLTVRPLENGVNRYYSAMKDVAHI